MNLRVLRFWNVIIDPLSQFWKTFWTFRTTQKGTLFKNEKMSLFFRIHFEICMIFYTFMQFFGIEVWDNKRFFFKFNRSLKDPTSSLMSFKLGGACVCWIDGAVGPNISLLSSSTLPSAMSASHPDSSAKNFLILFQFFYLVLWRALKACCHKTLFRYKISEEIIKYYRYKWCNMLFFGFSVCQETFNTR